MFLALYQFFENIFYSSDIFEDDGHLLEALKTTFSFGYYEGVPATMEIGQYLVFICSLISFVIILVLCCLFVFKIVKLIGGLIR